MNNKHIACLIILFFCILIVEGVLTIQTKAKDMKANAEKARMGVTAAQVKLRDQRTLLEDLRKKSDNLLKYLDAWEPFLAELATPESGELYVNTLIKKNNLLLLSQKFDVVPNKTKSAVPNATNTTIPQIVRANLIIEDDFAKSINWLGEIEKDLPAARITSLNLVRGQSGNDLKMNLIIDVPLAKAREEAPPEK